MRLAAGLAREPAIPGGRYEPDALVRAADAEKGF